MSETRYRLSVTLRSVRDLAVPLGAFANVYCTFTAPPLAGSHAGRRTRTTPPVLLPRQGAVVLPKASSASYVFSVDASEHVGFLDAGFSRFAGGAPTRSERGLPGRLMSMADWLTMLEQLGLYDFRLSHNNNYYYLCC